LHDFNATPELFLLFWLRTKYQDQHHESDTEIITGHYWQENCPVTSTLFTDV